MSTYPYLLFYSLRILFLCELLCLVCCKLLRCSSMTVLTVFAVDYLEVLDGGLGDPAVEVEHMRRRFFVPHRRLVVKLDQIFHPSVLVPYQQAVTFLPSICTT